MARARKAKARILAAEVFVMVNTRLIKSAMVAKGYTYEELSALTDISVASISRKFNNKQKFTVDEIETISAILKIADDDIVKYFFNER